jgi:hypothetical protein
MKASFPYPIDKDRSSTPTDRHDAMIVPSFIQIIEAYNRLCYLQQRRRGISLLLKDHRDGIYCYRGNRK